MVRYLIIVLMSFSLFIEAGTLSLLKPMYGYHFIPRDHPLELSYNSNYTTSFGFSYLYKDIGLSVIYVDKNSLNNNAWYIHGERKFDNLSILLGIRNGYPKKVLNRSKTDFILSGGIQYEYCFDYLCPTIVIAPNLLTFLFKVKLVDFSK